MKAALPGLSAADLRKHTERRDAVLRNVRARKAERADREAWRESFERRCAESLAEALKDLRRRRDTEAEVRDMDERRRGLHATLEALRRDRGRRDQLRELNEASQKAEADGVAALEAQVEAAWK